MQPHKLTQLILFLYVLLFSSYMLSLPIRGGQILIVSTDAKEMERMRLSYFTDCVGVIFIINPALTHYVAPFAVRMTVDYDQHLCVRM